MLVVGEMHLRCSPEGSEPHAILRIGVPRWRFMSVTRSATLLTFAALLMALPTGAANKYSGEFLTHGVGARALGMGSAFVAVANDATAGYWNPAGLVDVVGEAVHLMHSETFGDVVNYDTGAYVRSLEKGSAFALTVVRLSIDDIAFTDFYEGDGRIYYDATKITWESDSEAAMLLSYARPISDRMNVGGNLKIISKQIGPNSCYGLGFDLGAQCEVIGGLTLGANIQDVTTTFLVWDTKEREKIMPTAKLGVAYATDIESMDGRVVLAADADFRFEKRWMADEYHVGDVTFDTHYGLEFSYRDLVAVRGGLAMGQLTAGAGIGIAGFVVDYAYGKHEYLDSSHRVSAAYVF